MGARTGYRAAAAFGGRSARTCGDVFYVVVREAAPKRWHCILAVPDLLPHSLLTEAAIQVLLERLFFERLARQDYILASPVACHAVGREYGFACFLVTSKCWCRSQGERSSSAKSGGSIAQLLIDQRAA